MASEAKSRTVSIAKNIMHECTICYNLFSKDELFSKFSCAHKVCQYCAAKLLYLNQGKVSCPICRNVVQELFQKESDELWFFDALLDHLLFVENLDVNTYATELKNERRNILRLFRQNIIDMGIPYLVRKSPRGGRQLVVTNLSNGMICLMKTLLQKGMLLTNQFNKISKKYLPTNANSIQEFGEYEVCLIYTIILSFRLILILTDYLIET